MTGTYVSEAMITAFLQTFVNRPEYTVAAKTAAGEWSWRRPSVVVYVKGRRQQRFWGITRKILRQHLEGETTIGLYAIRLVREAEKWVSRCKWIAIDADYETALGDLGSLQYELHQLGVTAVVENSRRGAHLWVFNHTSLVAKQCRLLVSALANRLNVPVKGVDHPEGIEIFPRQDSIRPGAFGNGIRAPLGVHRKDNQRYWFADAPYTVGEQLEFLAGVPRLTAQQLKSLVSELAPTRPGRSGFGAVGSAPEQRKPSFPGPKGSMFRITKHVGPLKRCGRNWVTQCPACRAAGKDTHKDNLSISVAEPTKYICWAHCSKHDIRAALGVPIRFQ